MAEFDIFISYRRGGGFETAKHLYDLLRHEGYAVSFDIDTLREGKFNVALLSRIKSCQDFVLVVDPHAFDRTLDPNFNPEQDWLRQELSYALSLQKNVIPILLAGASFPDGLPDDIHEVKFMNGPGYSKDYFDSFYGKLKSFLISKPRSDESPILELSEPDKPSGAEIHIEPDTDCAVFRFKNKVLDATNGEDNIIYLQKGKHRLTFASHRFPDVKEQIVIDVPSSEYSDIISIQLRLRELENIPFTLVEKEGKFGFVGPRGELMIPYLYENIEDYFSEYGVALVMVGNKWGIINKAGHEIVPPIYDELFSPNENALVLAVIDDWKCGVIDLQGKIVAPFQYETDRYSSLPNGLDLIGFIKEDGKIGFLDSMGKEAIPFIYDDYDDLGFDTESGLACVQKDGKYGFIAKNGMTIIPFGYDEAHIFSNGMAYVRKSDKVGFINPRGEVVIPLEYDDAEWYFRNNYVGICKNGKWGVIDKLGHIVIPLIYDEMYDYDKTMVKAKKGDKWFLIDMQNNLQEFQP